MRHHLHAVVPTALALLCGVSLFVGPSTPVEAKMPPIDPGFPSWRVQIFTGNDDLRDDSEAWVTLRTPSRTYECRVKSLRPPGFPAHSDRAMNCAFDGPPALRADLWRAVATVHFRSHNHDFESDDKWDIRRLVIEPFTVAYVPGSIGSMCLYDMYDRRRDTEFMTLTTSLPDHGIDRLEWRNHCVHF